MSHENIPRENNEDKHYPVLTFSIIGVVFLVLVIVNVLSNSTATNKKINVALYVPTNEAKLDQKINWQHWNSYLMSMTAANKVVNSCKWVSKDQKSRATRILSYMVKQGNMSHMESNRAIFFGKKFAVEDLSENKGCRGKFALKYKKNFFIAYKDKVFAHVK